MTEATSAAKVEVAGKPGVAPPEVETHPLESIVTRDDEELFGVGQELFPARRDQLIEEMAEKVVARRLETMAVFLLESHRPLSFVASQSLLVSAPLLGAFFGFDRINEWAKLLADRENLDRLIDRIERLAQER